MKNLAHLKIHAHIFKAGFKDLLSIWAKEQVVSKILNHYQIDLLQFLKEFAALIIQYYYNVIIDKAKLDDCPLDEKKLMKFLLAKNVKAEDFFLLCISFKNAFVIFAQNKQLFSYEVSRELDYIFQYNFFGVLQHYTMQQSSLQDELQEQQNVIIEQSKSAAMGEMISMIAHQWRQPLQTISILSQKLTINMMTEGKLEPAVLEKVVDDIAIQLNYMSKTIDDFRDFFKPNKKQEKITLDQLAQKAYSFLEMMFKTDSIEYHFTKYHQNITVSIYINEIVQVLINIFKNARDAMMALEPEQRAIEVKIDVDETYGIIEIADTGRGIPAHIIHKIFDPYFSTKSNKNGTGLGLYMCKTIVEQHCNGKLSVKNGEKGAIFRIELPLQSSKGEK